LKDAISNVPGMFLSEEIWLEQIEKKQMARPMMAAILEAGCVAKIPKDLPKLEGLALKANFQQNSEPATGALLKAFAATKPGGKLLELGTGAGLGTSWLLDGMTEHAHLISVDRDESIQEIARDVLGSDKRVDFVHQESEEFLKSCQMGEFDFIFADAFAGKYEFLDEALFLLKQGAVYISDDMLPQANWQEGQEFKIPLMKLLLQREDIITLPLNWGTGYAVCVKK